MKKLLSLIIICLLLLSVLPTAAFAERTDDLADTGGDTVYTDGDFQYKVLDDGTAEIVKSNTNYIPLAIDGKTVTSIGDSAYIKKDMGTTLVIPDSVVRIGRRAFHNCNDLIKVTLPETLEYIGEDAFTWTNIYQIYIPRNTVLDYNEGLAASPSRKTDGRPFYSNSTFNGKKYSGDSWLISEKYTEPDCENRRLPVMQFSCLDQPDGTVHIWYATTLVDTKAEFTVPTTINGKKVSGIEKYAFHGDRYGWTDVRTDYELEKGYLDEKYYYDSNGNRKYYTYDADRYFGNKTLNITLDGDAAVERDAFYGTVKLHITGDVPEGNFANQQYLTELTIEDGVTNIGAHAFENCSDLKSVTIAKSVKNIGQNAFGYYGYNLRMEDFTVYGYRNTAAEKYANDNDFTFVPLDKDFDLWVGSTRVTETNCDDILGDGTARFDPETNTLTLNNANITDYHTDNNYTYAIFSKLQANLTVVGSGTIGTSEIMSGIVTAGGGLILDGNFTITSGEYGISSITGVDFNGGRITVNGTVAAFLAPVTVSAQITRLDVTGSDYAIGSLAGGVVIDPKVTYVLPKNGTIKSNIICDADGNLAPHVILEGKPSFILGDADTDGEVTIFDATAIQRHLAELSVTKFSEKPADADEDGDVTIFDATAIQRYLAQLPTNPNIGKNV